MPESFCAGCGASLPPDARFCPGCGRARTGAGVAPVPGGESAGRKTPVAAIAVFAVLLAAGAAAFWLRGGEQSGARAVPGSPNAAAAPLGAPAAGMPGDGQMPADHPPLEIPAEARVFLDDLAKKAEAAPKDAEAWKKLARARYRATMLDPSFETGAREALAHVLELEPKDTETLRMSANMYYQQRRFAEAEKGYRRYLEADPNDAGVQTDLASSVLFQGRIDDALKMYRDVIAAHPDFVQAHVNLGIALHGSGNPEEAMKSFEHARTLATDPKEREAIDEIIAMAKGETPPGAAADRGAGAMPASGAPTAPPSSNAKSAFQKGVDQLLGAHTIVAPKIKRIDWTGDATASVHLANFPMDSMPPVVRNKFKSTMNGKIASLATDNAVASVRVDLVDDADGRVMDTLDGKELIGAFDQPQE